MDLPKLLTEMTVDELKSHLSSLRKVHTVGAVTPVRRQSASKEPKQDRSVAKIEKLKAGLTPADKAKLRALLGMS